MKNVTCMLDDGKQQTLNGDMVKNKYKMLLASPINMLSKQSSLSQYFVFSTQSTKIYYPLRGKKMLKPDVVG